MHTLGSEALDIKKNIGSGIDILVESGFPTMKGFPQLTAPGRKKGRTPRLSPFLLITGTLDGLDDHYPSLSPNKVSKRC